MEEQNANSNSSSSGYSNSNHNNNNGLGVNRSSSKIAKGSIKRSGSGGGGGVIQSAAANKQKQTSVFKIDKSDFRIAVQRLTGTPPASDNRNVSSPQPPPLSSRLHKIRPPPLSFTSTGDGGLVLPRLPLLSLASPPPSAFGRTLLGFDGNTVSPAAMQLPSPSFFSQLPPLTPGDNVWANTPDALVSQWPENFPAPWSANWGDPIPSYNRILPVTSPAHQFTIPSPLPSPGGLGVPLSPSGLFSPLPALFPSPTAIFPTTRGSLNDSATGGLTAGFSFSHGHM